MIFFSVCCSRCAPRGTWGPRSVNCVVSFSPVSHETSWSYFSNTKPNFDIVGHTRPRTFNPPTLPFYAIWQSRLVPVGINSLCCCCCSNQQQQITSITTSQHQYHQPAAAAPAPAPVSNKVFKVMAERDDGVFRRLQW